MNQEQEQGPDIEQRLAHLQQELTSALEGLQIPDLSLHQTYTGRDATGSVSVSIAGQWRAQQVSLAEGWRSRIGVPELGPAVVEAYDAAADEAGEDLRQQVEAGTAPPPPAIPQAMADAMAPPSLSELSDLDLASTMERLIEQLDAATERMAALPSADEVIARMEAAEPEAPETDGVAAAVAATGQVLAVTINPRFADKAPTATLADAITQAIADAYAALPLDPPDPLPGAGA